MNSTGYLFEFVQYYLYTEIFQCIYYTIPVSPRCVLQFFHIFFFYPKNPLIIWSQFNKSQLYSTGVFTE